MLYVSNGCNSRTSSLKLTDGNSNPLNSSKESNTKCPLAATLIDLPIKQINIKDFISVVLNQTFLTWAFFFSS